jgi:hypothetical protein
MRVLIQYGFSMVQGMVISSFLAGSALIATRMISTQKMAVKSAETKDHILQLHKMVYADLQNREHCYMTLYPVIGSALTTNNNYTLNSIMVKTDNSVTGLQRFTVNDGLSYDPTKIYMNGNVTIKSMTLKTTANLGDPQPLVINYRRLEGNKSKSRTKVGFGGSSISKTINIRLQRETPTSTDIKGCYAIETSADADSGTGNEDLNQEFCDNLGANGESIYTWDPVRNICVMKQNVCPDKYVFEGIDSTGQKICRSINEYLPYLIQSGSSPCTSSKTSVKLVLDPVTNKVSMECEEAAACTIVGSTKTCDQCTAAGGTLVDITGGKTCRFNAASCPAGWSQYLNWSTTIPKSYPCNSPAVSHSFTCKGVTESVNIPAISTSITSASHAWGNIAKEHRQDSIAVDFVHDNNAIECSNPDNTFHSPISYADIDICDGGYYYTGYGWRLLNTDGLYRIVQWWGANTTTIDVDAEVTQIGCK